jgi:hypothetical protein
LILSGGLKEEAEAPIDLFSGGVLHGSRYEDLIFERSAQPFDLGCEIGNENGTLRFVTTLRFVVERHALVVERFVLETGDQKSSCTLLIASPDEFAKSNPKYRCIRDGYEFAPAEAHFDGLFPDWVGCDEALAITLKGHRDRFRRAFTAPAYLGPFRSQGPDGLSLPAQNIRVLGPRGERAGDMIADDTLRSGGELARRVEKWFDDSMGGNRVILKHSERQPRLVVLDKERNIEVEMSETGAGFAQVLPVVVQTFARLLGRIQSPLLITEQPELHLHPAAHGAVADLFVSAVNEATAAMPVIMLCETHSEQIITRIRRRIAEGKLQSDQVRIHSVAHKNSEEDGVEAIREIKMDNAGTPDAWPIGVFDEAFQDLVELREAVREKAS